MKNVIFIAVALFGLNVSGALAQAPSPEATVKEKMKPLMAWVGHWKGEGSMQMGPGDPKKSSVDERIESKLDGTLLLIEGIGKATDPSTNQEAVVHHAFATLTYDANSNQYKFRTHLKDGKMSDAWFKQIGENNFQWGLDTPQGGKIRYTIYLNPAAGTWEETGEYSKDGATWMKFFSMNLKKIE